MRVINQAEGENWMLYNGDSTDVLRGLPDHSVGLSIYSPPFSSLYTYTPSPRDLGNVRSRDEFFEHHTFIRDELLRVMIPGRVVAVHAEELQEYATRDGQRGRYDFPGDYIRHMREAGFAYGGRITIDGNPQTAAIRNHPTELLFATLRRDASKLVPAIADYLLVFRAPGKNPVPVVHPIDEETWINWARPVWPSEVPPSGVERELFEAAWGVHPVWYDIRETEILPAAGSKENDDERHLCPLQLPVIRRAVRLWSNPDEVVLSPFAGIGSEGVATLECGRRFVGSELKPSYFKVAVKFLQDAERRARMPDLFSFGVEAS